MFIHVGKKFVVERPGWVACACTSCKAIEPHFVTIERLYATVYGAAVGDGQVWGVTAKCRSCSSVRFIDPAEFIRFDPEYPEDLDLLIERTCPRAFDLAARELTTDDRLMDGQLEADDRVRLVCNALIAGDNDLRKRERRMHIDRRSGMLLVVSVAWWALAFRGLAFQPSPTGWNAATIVQIAGPSIATALCLWSVHTDVRRHLVRTRMSWIRERIARFGPTIDEVASAISRAKRMGVRTASFVRADDLAPRPG